MAEIPSGAGDARRVSLFAEMSAGASGPGVESFLGGIVVPAGGWAIGLDVRFQELANLIDDPSFSDDGLRIGDRALSLVLARRLPASLAVGVSGSLIGSTILGTSASSRSVGASIAWDPSSRLRVVLAASGLGASTTYHDAGGGQRSVDRPRLLRAGVGVTTVGRRALTHRVFLDYERGSHADYAARYVLATEAAILGVLTLKAGFAREQPAQAASGWTSVAGAGVLLSISKVGFVYSYLAGANEYDLTPRHRLGLMLTL